jgi:hypothetical protein
MLSAQEVKLLLMAAVTDRLHSFNRMGGLELVDGIIVSLGRRPHLITGIGASFKGGGKSTLNRLELSRPQPTRYHRIAGDEAAIEALPITRFPAGVPAHAPPDHTRS